jgi:HPt (histidine-containing phosphotransfer) domain-containing protein
MLGKWLPATGQGAVADDTLVKIAASTQFPVLDRAVLPKQIGDDPAMIDRFFRDYQISAQKAAGEIRAAIADGDWKAASGGAHKLKSSSRAVGALALGEVCQRLEQAGKDADAHATPALAAELDIALAAVLEALNR